MRALIQRVEEASVDVVDAGTRKRVGSIGKGLCVLVGVTHDDTTGDAERLADRIAHLRVFDDADGVMNLSASDVGAEILVVSQFTLYGNTSKGRRPSWIAAARPEIAEPIIEHLVAELRQRASRQSYRIWATRDKIVDRARRARPSPQNWSPICSLGQGSIAF